MVRDGSEEKTTPPHQLYVMVMEPLHTEQVNSKLRDELLDRELFLHIDELRYVVDRWGMNAKQSRSQLQIGRKDLEKLRTYKKNIIYLDDIDGEPVL
jgi:hypothetical protein